ncbi:MAG: heavy-metal-associated domain-containing protein [Planctomycetes bacterium]|nr:heavy-metal-associated domain-containing protein [Planctomycetota bacterium]
MMIWAGLRRLCLLIHRLPGVRVGLMAIWFTATLGCGSSTRVATLSDEPAIRDDGGMISLDNSLEPLIERFNTDRDRPRVVAIVSATCGACVAGAIAVNESVVRAYPSAEVSIFVVWIDILPSDDYAAAQRVAGIFDDPRVRQFHDPNRLAGDAFAKGLLEEPPAWDMYLLYAATPQQLWVDYPPKPTDWMHQLGSAADPARERGGHPLVVGLYDAMSDLGFEPAIESPPSKQKIASAKRATNAMVSAARSVAAANDPSLPALAQCGECAKAGSLGQCTLAGYRKIVATRQQIPGFPGAVGFGISGTNNPAVSLLDLDPRLGPISGEVIVLDIEGMRCPDCPTKLALSVLYLPGVERVMVDFDASEARVAIDPASSVKPKVLIAAIEQSGFSATRRGEK